jgi:hypothetical protein
MQRRIPIAIAAALTACSPADNRQYPASDDPQNEFGPTSAASMQSSPDAGTVGREGIDCEAANAERGSGADVVGVTIGMVAEQAYAKIACSNPSLRVEYSSEVGLKLPSLPDGKKPRTAITANGGQEQIEAWLVGLPGQERVVMIRRQLRFDSNEQPQVAQLEQQLRAKYGAFVQSPSMRQQAGVLRSADGQPILVRQAGSTQLFYRCMPSMHGRLSLYPECGLSVGVHLEPNAANSLLAQELRVIVTHGSYGTRLLDEYRAAAANAAQQQQTQEVQDATGRAPAL